MPASVERALDRALDKALSVQRPVVLSYLDHVKVREPNATPAQVIARLERRYRLAVIGTGAASGAFAAVPGAGTAKSIASGAAEITAFLSATAMYVLAVAEVHAVPTGDPQVRRALVLTVVLGDIGEAALAGAEIEPQHWAKVIGKSTSKDAIQGVNGRLAHLFVTRFGARQSALLAGRALPYGVGAGIGALGNAALARSVIGSSRRAFGKPPDRFPPAIVEAS